MLFLFYHVTLQFVVIIKRGNDRMKNKALLIGGMLIVAISIAVYVFLQNNEPVDIITEETTYDLYDTNTPARIGAVELIVEDLARSVTFYTELIGFDILAEESQKVTLTADGQKPLLVLESVGNSIERPFGTTGLYHFAILLPNRASLADTILHLSEAEYPLQGASNHQYSDALYLADPDGNGMEIYADLPPETWAQDQDGRYQGGTYAFDLDKTLAEATSIWTGLPEATRIGHMHLQVAELDKTEQFYVEGLGFDITSKKDGSLFLSKDRYHHYIGLNTWSGLNLPAPPENARGLKKFKFFFTQEELDEAKVQLTRLDFHFEENADSITVKDPSGNTIEIIVV